MMRGRLGERSVAGLSIARGRMRRGLSALTRRVVALLALVGVLVHAGLPLLHQQRAAATPLDDTLVICSAFGVKVVQLAELHGASNDGDVPQTSRIYYCPICLAQIAGTAMLPDAVTLAVPVFAGVASALPRTAAFVAPSQYSSLRARAPPATA
jgi:hypothetical protein